MTIKLSKRSCLRTLIVTLSLSAGTVFAQDVNIEDVARNPVIANYKGYAEFKMAHYDVARQIWEALDRINYSEGAFNLGILSEDGLGTPRDPQKALELYERAASLGSQRATYRLGKLYWFGAPGIAKDPVKGRKYMELAAAGGDKESAEWLKAATGNAPAGALAEADAAESRGDFSSAAKLLTTAAENGNATAQTRLAWYYEAGRGVQRDLAQAANWFSQAAKGGNGEAMYALAVMHRTGAGMPQDTALSLDWLQRSAKAGYARAATELQAMETAPKQ